MFVYMCWCFSRDVYESSKNKKIYFWNIFKMKKKLYNSYIHIFSLYETFPFNHWNQSTDSVTKHYECLCWFMICNRLFVFVCMCWCFEEMYTKVLKIKNIFLKYFQNEKKVIQFLHSYILSLSNIPIHLTCSFNHWNQSTDSVTKHYGMSWLITKQTLWC